MSAPVNWGRAARLTRAGLQWGGWQGWALLVLVVLLTAFANLGALRIDRWAVIGGFQVLAILMMALYVTTGPANVGWRYLPVTAQDRRAAAWINICLVPLALAGLNSLMAFALSWLPVGKHPELVNHRIPLALFGVQGTMLEVLAVILILFANWPTSVMRYWQPGQRQMRDWLIYVPFGAIMLGGSFTGGELAQVPGTGLPSTVAALALCGLGLPLTQRFIRLDQAAPDGLGLDINWLPELHLKGVAGHLIGQGLRVVVISALLLGIGAAIKHLLPAIVPMARGAAAEGFRFGIGIWSRPGPLALMLVMINLQMVLRQRRMFLSLPHGRFMVLAHPLFVATIAFGMACAVQADEIVDDGLAMTVTGITYVMVLALAYVFLALNLCATRMIEVMLAGMIIAVPLGFLGMMGADMRLGGYFVMHWASVMAGTGMLMLMASLTICRHLLNTSRRPYRPWPIANNRWRAG